MSTDFKVRLHPSVTPSHLAFALTAAGMLGGAIAHFMGRPDVPAFAWAAATLVALVPLIYTVIRSLLWGKTGVDFIALLAMVGALILGEYLAGAVIALMLTGGRGLEDFAASRARRELSALVQRMPRTVHRHNGKEIVSAPIDTVRPGDLLLVKLVVTPSCPLKFATRSFIGTGNIFHEATGRAR